MTDSRLYLQEVELMLQMIEEAKAIAVRLRGQLLDQIAAEESPDIPQGSA